MVRILFFLTFLILSSCANEIGQQDQFCQVTFLYSIAEEPISLTPVTGELMVEFLDSKTLEIQIQSLFARYDFLDEEFFPVGIFTSRVTFW